MSGITGIYYKTNPQNFFDIIRMNDSIKHRGPDDEGYISINVASKKFNLFSGKDSLIKRNSIYNSEQKEKLWFGHRRLSTIDLSSLAHQPMIDQKENVCIVFDGAIYNYREIREELKNKGYSFKSQSDTEVIIYSYIEWGKSFVQKLNGNWSFLIYDKNKNILFGSRDRFGVKPLYFINNHNFIAFASEIKALLAIKNYSCEINSEMVYRYLLWGQETFKNSTFFKEVYEIPPACTFTYSFIEDSFNIEKYYSIETVSEWESFNYKKSLSIIEKSGFFTKKSIERRLVSDVPIGSCLSGGIDSSSIVCNVNRFIGSNIQIGEKQKVVTACFTNEKIDESKWANIVVESTGAEWHRTYPGMDDLLSDLEDMVFYQDYPFQSTSIYAQYRVMKKAKEIGIKVLLDGQGGDELFTGYSNYFYVFMIEMLKRMAFPGFIREASHFNNMSMNFSRILGKRINKLFNKTSFVLKDYLNPDFFESMTGIDQEAENNQFYGGLNNYMKTLMEKTSLPTLLKYADRNSMRFSLDLRAPFADDIELIDYIFTIPSSYKIHNGYSKYLLREGCADVLPEQIKKRVDKIGFETPEARWLCESQARYKEYLNDGLIDYFNVEKLRTDWASLVNSAGSNYSMIWRIINFSVWMKVYFSDFSIKNPYIS